MNRCRHAADFVPFQQAIALPFLNLAQKHLNNDADLILGRLCPSISEDESTPGSENSEPPIGNASCHPFAQAI